MIMDNRTEKKRLKELKKMKKRALITRREEFLDQQKTVSIELEETQQNYNALNRSLISVLESENKDKAEVAEVLQHQIEVAEKKLKNLNEREKLLTEEIELMSRALKNDADAKAGKGMLVGSLIMGTVSAGLSGWGLWKSHTSFEDGSMVDKATKSTAERINPFDSFKKFFFKK